MGPTSDPIERKRFAGVYFRLHGIKVNYDLSAIPDEHGFIFDGLTKDGDFVPCIVWRGPDKKCLVYWDAVRASKQYDTVRLTFTHSSCYVFDQLVAWKHSSDAERTHERTIGKNRV